MAAKQEQKPVFFYGRKFPGLEEYESIQISLEWPDDGQKPEDIWQMVIGQVDEQIIKIKSVEDKWEVTMGKSLQGKTVDEFRGRDYLVAADLDGKAWVVTIKDVQETERWNPAVQEKQVTSCLVFESGELFKQLPEPRVLLLNVTDEQSIVKFLGNAYGNWVGKQVELYLYNKTHKGKQLTKIGVRQPKGTPASTGPGKEPESTPAKTNGHPRPWEPETLRDALQLAAKKKVEGNEKLNAPIQANLAKVLGAFGPKLFYDPSADFDDAEHKKRVINYGTDNYHRLLNWVFPAEKEGKVSANNILQAEGVVLVNWMLAPHKLVPADLQSGNMKKTFALPLDDMARQEAEKWLENNLIESEAEETEPEQGDDFEIPF